MPFFEHTCGFSPQNENGTANRLFLRKPVEIKIRMTPANLAGGNT
jgi:hypothetical protein